MKKNGEVVPILECEDDTIIFLEADVSMVETLQGLFCWFEEASGLHVNVHISKVYQVNHIECWVEVFRHVGKFRGITT